MDKLQPVLHLSQVAGSAYTLYFCYISITNLQKYEQKTEKAAEYSQTAADQLHKTRMTQGSALVTILTSLLSSAFLAYSCVRPNSALSTGLSIGLNAGNLVNVILTRIHVGGFWKGKAKVPLVEGYNDAIGSTATIMQMLERLALVWFVSTGYTVMTRLA